MQNILESQVSDLSSLVDSPIAISVSGTPAAIPIMGAPPGPARDAPSIDRSVRGESSITSQGQGNQRNDNRMSIDGRDAKERDGREGGGGGAGQGNGNQKRKSDEVNGGQQQGNGQPRAKRNRYISIACNECKRRKIKCNGQTPCQRCGNLSLSCQYAPNCCATSFKDSPEYAALNTHLASLQSQVDTLYASMRALQQQAANGGMSERSGGRMGSMSVSERQSTTTASPSMQFRDQRLHKCTPKFAGPTSSAYSLDVAKNTLQNMGYSGLTSMESGDQEMADETPLHTPPMSKAVLPAHLWGREGRDVLGAVGYEEAARLVGVFEKEIWVMYPFLDLDVVQSTCQAWYQTQSQPENNGRNGQQQQQGGGVEDIPEDDLNILKMVIAIATVVEGSGRSDFGERLYDTIKKSADEVMHREGVSIRDIPIMALIATYHFHCDEEALAWRTITVASRLCIELGLHRSDSLYKNFPDPAVRASALRLFWSIYCLDRRWSFGTGMPFAMQDADIDPALPEPEVRGGLPYLGCMIEYSRIGGRVWKSVAGLGETGEAGEGMKGEEVGYLDYKVLQWAKSLPEPLKFHPERPPTNNRAVHRLQTILYLRTNQMRILIYRPVLHSASSILSNLNYAHTVVDLSKDTIRTLAHLNSTTDIYRAQQVCFNYFLISALAVLFLASCHAPVQFSGKCKEEFYMALELVRGFSSKSYVSKRLWRTIKGLKEVGPKLGLDLENSSRTVSNPGGAGGNEDHNAALAMAGLASGGNNNQMEMGYGNSPPINGFVMSNEMTNLFEAALGAGTGLQGGYSPAPEDGGGMGIMGIQGQMGWQGGGNDDELYRQLRDLF